MYKRIVSSILFAVGLLCLDRVLAGLIAQLYSRTTTGEGAGDLRGALNRTDADLLIFGTSRARHHIIPQILHDSLNQNVFNCGSNGRGIYYARILERMMLARGTKAKTFLLQVEPFDLFDTHPERASVAAPLIDIDPVVRELLVQATSFGELKFASRTYRFNSMLFPIVRNSAWPSTDARGADGFIGLTGNLGGMDPGTPFESSLLDSDRPFDERALPLYRDFIGDAKRAGITVVLFDCPLFRTSAPTSAEQRALDAFARLAADEDLVSLSFDERNFPQFLDGRLFNDRAHLNADGARMLTTLLATKLKELRH